MVCNVKAFIDVTNDMIEKAIPNNHIVKDRLYFEYENKRYFVDGKNVILDYSLEEKEIALWLESTFGGKIYMLPRINVPENIVTPDYLWNNEYWDLKEIYGNGKHTLDTSIKKKRNQSNNFILDISHSKLSIKEAIRQLNLIFLSKNRKWVNIIILVKNRKLIKIYKRK
ncbi:MAG: hypothetical protein NC483_02520 [Ruminococcus sp.]|nr:hypothetical protein [Ruminococcus sp.]